jgi:hypothetical protein
MILHGAIVCAAAYMLKFVVPPVTYTGSPGADLAKEPVITTTVRTVVHGLRKLCGLSIGRSLPVTMHRLANGALRTQLVQALRLSFVSYGLHSIVVLHGERAQSEMTRKVVRAAHVLSTAVDIAAALTLPFASSVPPVIKLLSSGLLSVFGSTVVFPAAGALRNFDDPLRAVLLTTSVLKSLAVLTTTTYGAPTGHMWSAKAACWLLLVPTCAAPMLPTSSQPLAHPRASLPLIAMSHIATDVLTLAVFSQLSRLGSAPAVKFPGMRLPVSCAATFAAIDLVALLLVGGIGMKTKTLYAFKDRVVRIAIPEALFHAPPPTAALSPKDVQEWSKDFDFASTMSSPELAKTY